VPDYAVLRLHGGFYPCDASQPIFASDELAESYRQAVHKSPTLPQELQNQIQEYIYLDEPAPLQALIDTSTTDDDSIELIQPLIYFKMHCRLKCSK